MIRVFSKIMVVSTALAAIAALGFIYLDARFPLPLPESETSFAITVVADDGTPLRSFPDDQGVWRYPVTLKDVSPLYVTALVNYEDRMFWLHPGINPWSLLRAFFQYVKAGEPITGGSTLTMQTARILSPHNRSISGKCRQMFRALQLEYRFSKNEILTMYLNYAPFGGPIEGVQAASYAYLGKSAKELSHAEAALLAVLPQAPSRLRPDRHPDKAEKARNKVLDRMARFNVWEKAIVEEAKVETVSARFKPRPMIAPLLARRLKSSADRSSVVKTTIDPMVQQTVANIIGEAAGSMPDRVSAAALVVENDTLFVKAYTGSADFFDDSRFGHVDMIRARRSPGSTLKPFLYAFAIEEGLIHSESMLMDVPVTVSGYRPGNFTEGFIGPVAAAEALQRSLNIPAVDLLDRIGEKFFDARLRQGGFHLKYPPHGKPNLSMILGGVGVSLEDLVSAFTAFGRNGLSGKLRFTVGEPLEERRMMHPGSAYIVRQLLQEKRRPDLPGGRLSLGRSRDVAWKTGTSYGFRDAWTVGVTDRYTVGVWVGKPDGTPSPGQYGRATAAPLLFSIIDSLPRSVKPQQPAPECVSRVEICWPLGTAAAGTPDSLCHEKHRAWVFNGVVPPTLPDRTDSHWQRNPVTILVNPATGLRLDADCQTSKAVLKTVARWPKAAWPWLSTRQKSLSKIPKLDPVCGKPVSESPETVRIVGIETGTVFRPAGADTNLPEILLEALGGKGRLFWLLDGELIRQADIHEPKFYRFRRPGRFLLTVMDLAGDYDAVDITVIGGKG